nr:MAG TPA: hypothetical protein [Caudoviricetes sp.]
MLETTFLDRVSQYPGRVILTPVAGQPDTYTMTRADSPTVEGTPLDKATFDSIVQSRLTGRYYKLQGIKTALSSQTGITANPIPQTGWTGNTGQKISGGYEIEANDANGNNSVERAFDGDTSTYWESMSGTSAYIQVALPSQINVKKMRLSYNITAGYSITMTLIVQGSKTGSSWTNLYSTSSNSLTNTEITLTTTGNYGYYRLYFDFSSGGENAAVQVRDWQLSNYSVNTYKNALTFYGIIPTSSWTNGQRVTIYVDEGVDVFGVMENTVGGINCYTVLQPGKFYLLHYDSDEEAFLAEEE